MVPVGSNSWVAGGTVEPCASRLGIARSGSARTQATLTRVFVGLVLYLPNGRSSSILRLLGDGHGLPGWPLWRQVLGLATHVGGVLIGRASRVLVSTTPGCREKTH